MKHILAVSLSVAVFFAFGAGALAAPPTSAPATTSATTVTTTTSVTTTRSASQPAAMPSHVFAREVRGLPPMTLVSVDLKGVTGEQAFDELARQADLRLARVHPDARRRLAGHRVTLRAERQPLLLVLRELCAHTGVEPGLVLRPDGKKAIQLDAPRETFVPPMFLAAPPTDLPSWTRGPAVAAGPVLVVATSAARQEQRAVGAAVGASRPTLSLSFTLLAEPGVELLGTLGTPTFEPVVDDRGRRVAPPRPAPVDRGLPFTPGVPPAVTLTVPFTLPDGRLGGSIPVLRGSVLARVVTKRQRVAVPGLVPEALTTTQPAVDRVAATRPATRPVKREPAGDLDEPQGEEETPDGRVEQTVAGRRFRVAPVELTDRGHYRLRFTLLRDGRDDREWAEAKRGIVDHTGPKLADADGNPLPRVANSYGPPTPGGEEYVLTFSRESGVLGFPPTAPPAAVVWDVPVEVGEARIPFEFRDLPLP